MTSRPKNTYRSTRLTFVRDEIEPLRLHERFGIETPDGTFEMSKGDFRSTFPNVAASKSYQDNGRYSYSQTPRKAQKFLVNGRSRIEIQPGRDPAASATLDLPTENDVIAAIGKFLGTEGWDVLQSLNTGQPGVDVVAVHRTSGRRLHVEAKGATSSKPGTRRYGRPFKPDQVLDHVAKAFYAAARVPEDCSSAIAVPLNNLQKKYIQPIRKGLKILDIAVFWVTGENVVDTWNWEHQQPVAKTSAERR